VVVSLLAGMICSMAITNYSRAYDGGSQRRYLATPTGRKIRFRLRSDDPLPGGLYTLFQLAIYYGNRADLRRVDKLLESLRAGVGQERQWLLPWMEVLSGVVAWLRGEFDAAGSHLEGAAVALAAAAHHELDAVWSQPNDPAAAAHDHLALVGLVRGDLAGAEAELARTACRAEGLGFPQGPFNLAYTRFVESWIRIEAGQLDRAAALAADLTDQAERHGFDQWRLIGAAQQATVGALAALGADQLDPSGLRAHIATVIRFVDTWRRLGVNMYLTFYDSVVARLLIAAGQPQQARAHLDTALAQARDTGMCFYDAELLRLRAPTHADPDARQADIGAALELARSQGATLFELRAALDDYDLRGQPARAALIDAASRIPANNAWPELARAQASLSDDLPRI